jgi:glutaredoxin
MKKLVSAADLPLSGRHASLTIPYLLGLLLFAMFLTGAANAQVYKWTDKDGKIVYGDRPPPEATTSDLKIPVTSFGGQPVVKAYSSASAQTPGNATPSELVLYAADWCGYCRAAKAFFRANSIAFREVNVESDKSGAAEFKRTYGGGGVPLTVAGDKTIRGFSPESMLYFLKGSGHVSKNTFIEKNNKQ